MNKSKYCIILLNIVSILIFCGLVDLFIHNISDNNKREIFYCDILKCIINESNTFIDYLNRADDEFNQFGKTLNNKNQVTNQNKENDNICNLQNEINEYVIAENSLYKKKTNSEDKKQEVENSKFIPVKEKIVMYQKEQLENSEFIKETFYTEDPSTYISKEQLDYDSLINYDSHIKQDNSAPQILIYHTHSKEAFIDSELNNVSMTIVGVGDRLSEILHEEYGYNVIHNKEQYDKDGRDFAYSNAAVGIEKILSENPSIEIMIDLHRDETKSDVHLVKEIQGISMARFMFFNGMSYLRNKGAIESLPNKYINENLAFSFQLQLAAEEYYPGLTRKIYLKGYRYNLHYRPKSLLIELGSQTNTFQEAVNACGPIAHIINMVLKNN